MHPSREDEKEWDEDALDLVPRGKLTFHERVVLYRVGAWCLPTGSCFRALLHRVGRRWGLPGLLSESSAIPTRGGEGERA